MNERPGSESTEPNQDAGRNLGEVSDGPDERQETPVHRLSPEMRERLETEPDAVLAEAFSEHGESFRYLITFRMDRRLSGRVDSDDVLQEAFLAAKSRVPHYLAGDKYTLFAWLRLIVVQCLYDVHRRHLGADKRSVGKEIKLVGTGGRYAPTTSASIAGQIAAAQTTPSGVVVRGEALEVLEKTIATLSEQDQEVIAMRHFENLSNTQVAEVLNLSVTAASNRYVRALERLRELLERVGVGLPQ